MLDILATLASQRPECAVPIRSVLRCASNGISPEELAMGFERYASLVPKYADVSRKLAQLVRSNLLFDPILKDRSLQARNESFQKEAANNIGIGETVLVKSLGRTGLVEFYDVECGYYITHNIYEGAYYPKEDLQKVASFDQKEAAPRQLQAFDSTVVEAVRSSLGTLLLPAHELRFAGYSDVHYNPEGGIKQATGRVEMNMETGTGEKLHMEIPVQVIEGRVLEPSIINWDGRPYVIGQASFDEIRGSFSQTEPHLRGLFQAPIPVAEEVPRPNRPLFDTLPFDRIPSQYDTNYQDYGWGQDRRF